MRSPKAACLPQPQKLGLDLQDLQAAPVRSVWFVVNAFVTQPGPSDADALGDRDHQTALYTSPKLGNDKTVCCEGLGIWGALSTARDEDGQTWLFVPMGGPMSQHAPRFPITNGDNPHGSILAFKVVADAKTGNPVLDPAWVSGDFDVPDPVVIANGVVFGLATGENPLQRGLHNPERMMHTHPAVLRALDAKTGKELYNSGGRYCIVGALGAVWRSRMGGSSR